MIFFLAGPLTEEERLNRQPRSIQDQIVSTAAQCMKGVVNRFKDSGFDIDCLQSNNCNQADVNRLANNALGYLEKVQGGGCMTNSNCSPISRCNSKYLKKNIKFLYIPIYDLSIGSTETKYIKLNTKTQIVFVV